MGVERFATGGSVTTHASLHVLNLNRLMSNSAVLRNEADGFRIAFCSCVATVERLMKMSSMTRTRKDFYGGDTACPGEHGPIFV